MDSGTGFLAHDFEASVFIEKIVQLHSIWLKGAPYEEMRRKARRNVAENFAVQGSSRRLLNLLSSV